MTIKIISMDTGGRNTVSIFTGDYIRHTEESLPAREVAWWSGALTIGAFGHIDSEQSIIVSYVDIFDKDQVLIRSLLITPKSECFIMNDEGKTVDVFYSHVNPSSDTDSHTKSN